MLKKSRGGEYYRGAGRGNTIEEAGRGILFGRLRGDYYLKVGKGILIEDPG